LFYSAAIQRVIKLAQECEITFETHVYPSGKWFKDSNRILWVEDRSTPYCVLRTTLGEGTCSRNGQISWSMKTESYDGYNDASEIKRRGFCPGRLIIIRFPSLGRYWLLYNPPKMCIWQLTDYRVSGDRDSSTYMPCSVKEGPSELDPQWRAKYLTEHAGEGPIRANTALVRILDRVFSLVEVSISLLDFLVVLDDVAGVRSRTRAIVLKMGSPNKLVSTE